MAQKKQDNKSNAQGNSVRHTDANPPVQDDSVLAPTQKEVKKNLSKHSKFERKTGVKKEELDTRPVVDPTNGKTFAERTSPAAPWAEYQEEADRQEAKRAKDVQADGKSS